MTISAIITSLSLLGPPQIHDTRDLDFQVPSFTNAPRFSLNRSLTGRMPIDNPRQSRRVEREDKLLDLLLDEYGDEYSIIRWRGSLIIRKK